MVVVQETRIADPQKPLTPSEFVTLLQEGKEFVPGTVVDVMGIYMTPEEILHPAFQPDTSSVPKL